MTLQVEFHTKSLFDFWSGVMKEYPPTSKKAMLVLLPFASSYLCEIGFSAVATLKTKYRSRLNFESDLRVAVSDINPRFDKLCRKKQAHPSH